MDQKNQVIDRIKKANNVLVTVSSNPSVDQLAACIGLTLLLNKAGKHATAVFSGAIPSTIEFLEPEKTIEKNTDSLRDFIIALDKSKADKLRYKVEDQVVRIFITPYRTSISEKDLEFSQGDFNVDVVLALGVHSQADLDQAITAHGRILHDAAVVAVNVNVVPGGELGSINWVDGSASSLSELAMRLATGLDQKLVDGQIATAFLTGIVAETNRFSNAKTSPETMSASATLMGLGANQQLVATKLEPKPAPVPALAGPAAPAPETARAKSDGTLEISHDDKNAKPAEQKSAFGSEKDQQEAPQIHIDENGALQMPAFDIRPEFEPELPAPPAPEPKPAPAENLTPSVMLPEVPKTDTAPPTTESAEPAPKPVLPAEPIKQEGPHLILEPPTFGSQLTANTSPEDREPSSGDPLTPPHDEDTQVLEREPLEPASTSPIGLSVTPPTDEALPATSAVPGLTPGNEADASKHDDTPSPADANAAPNVSADEPKPDTAQAPAGLENVDELLKPLTAVTPETSPAVGSDNAPADAQAVTTPSDATAIDAATTSSAPAQDELTATPSAFSMPTPAPEPVDSTASATPLAADDAIKALTESVANPAANVDSARDAVTRAINNGAAALEPTEALNAQPLGAPLHEPAAAPPVVNPAGMVDPNAAISGATTTPLAQPPNFGPVDQLAQTQMPPVFTTQPPVSPTADIGDSTVAAPPVPPPMLPPVQM